MQIFNRLSMFIFLTFLPWVMYSQNSYEIKRDTVVLFSLYFFDDPNGFQTYAKEFSYVYLKGNIYHAKPYLDLDNAGCVEYSVGQKSDCDYKIIRKYQKMKEKIIISKEGLLPKKYYAYKSVKLDALFFTISCNIHADLNPYALELIGMDAPKIIHFVKFMSEKIETCALPDRVISFIEEKNNE